MMETGEVVQALVSPVNKLIDTVSGAIGKVYEPRQVRKMADAKAYEIETIAEAVRNNSDVSVVYDAAKISVEAGNHIEIAKRAAVRSAIQEIAKQRNIEAVVDNAYEELKNIEGVTSEPITLDWMVRFCNSVEDISNDYLRKIWGRILAGEVKRPNSYSYRTLENLRNMTQHEAEIFQRVSSLTLEVNARRFILCNDKINKKYNVNLESILKLEECGLMSSHAIALKVDVSSIQGGLIYTPQIIGMIKAKKKKQKLTVPAYSFTESGGQLITAIGAKADPQYILDCLDIIGKNNRNLNVTAHRIKSIDGGKINLDEVNILK